MIPRVKNAIIGAGAWGTTLAALASEQSPTTIWAREPAVVNAINERRENSMFLPGFPLPERLGVTIDLSDAVSGADMVVVAVPSPYVRAVLPGARGSIDPHALVVSVTKGIEAGTGQRMTEVISEILVDHDPARIGLLAGPNLAREVMAGHPSATCVAFGDLRYAQEVQRRFASDRFRVYTSSDVVGCEVSGAVKNIIAIAAGLADGLDYGMNTKAALVTRGLAELVRLGTAMGVTRSPFSVSPAWATSWLHAPVRSAATGKSANGSPRDGSWRSSNRQWPRASKE
jgi:glycerol-3-phosphate dehydrogenase (NAD(P)+)